AIEDPALAEACCRVYNDWLADYCRKAPERLIGIAAIPMQDVGAAVRELHRAKPSLGMHGAFVRPNPCNGRALHDPYFDRFWAAAAATGMPVGLHPSGAGDLPGALQGVPRRVDAHPNRTIVVLEAGGGWIGHWFDRFDHFAHVYAWMAPELRLKPSEY